MTASMTHRRDLVVTAAPLPIRLLVVVVPFVVAAALGFRRSLTVPLWRDEHATALHAALPLEDLVRSLSAGDAVLGPYYVLMQLFTPLWGLDEGMRIPSLVAFATTAAVVSTIALRWWGALPALGGGLFFALNGAAVTAGITARPYALMLLFVALAILAAATARPRGDWRWIGYSAVALAAVTMHLISLIAIVCIGVLAYGQPRGYLLRWLTWSTPALGAGVVIAAIGATQQGQIAWLTPADPRGALSALAQVSGTSAYRAVIWDAVGLLVLLAGAVAAFIAIRRTTEAADRGALLRPVVFAAVLGFAAPAALLLVSWVAIPVFTARYLTWVSLGGALLVAAAVSAATLRRPSSILAGVCAAILLVGSAIVAGQQFIRPPGFYDDVPSLLSRLDASAEPGDALAVIQRNTHSGVAYSLARTAKDQSWADDVRERLPSSSQPGVDVRSIAGTHPLALQDVSASGSTGGTVWIVSLDAPSQGEIAGIADALGCLPSAVEDPEFFGGMRLYEARCG